MTIRNEEESNYAHIAQVVDSRFYKYLVSRKFAVKDDDLIDGLFDEEDQNKKSENKIIFDKFERKKLDIEIRAEEKRMEKVNKSLELKAKVTDKLRPHYLNHMRKNIEDVENVILNLLKIPDNVSDILAIAYNQNSTMKKMADVLSVNNDLSRRILEIVNNYNFRKSIGRRDDQRKIDNIQSAIGYLGVEGYRALLPFVIFKGIIKEFYQVFPGMYDKVWKYALGKAVCTHEILKNSEYKDPMKGYILGFVSSLGVIAIYHQFYHSYEEVKLEKLESASKNKKFDVYDAIFTSEPDESVMSEMLIEFSATLPVQILDKLNWNIFPDIKEAIEEDAKELPVMERSVLGKALKQSISYSKFELLRRAKFFSKDHLEPFLSNANMSREDMKILINKNLRVLDLKQYIG